MSGLEQASREELLALLAARDAQVARQSVQLDELLERVEELTATNAKLVDQVTELVARLGQNSRNSSKPPSSDGPEAPERPSRRGKTGKRPGKQPGAPGSALAQVDPARLDGIVDHVPAACRGCGADLVGAADAGMVRRQCHDIPPVSVQITEHRLHKRRCGGCGVVTRADAPDGVSAPASYGPGLRTLAVYLVVVQHIAVERAAQLIADVTGAAPSTGWISTAVASCADALEDVDALIRTLCALAAVLHVDETSTSIAGARQWIHVAATGALTAYFLHPSRGRVAVDEFGVLPGYAGTAVHDALSVYDGDQYATARHAYCGAHILRELAGAADRHLGQAWPDQAIRALTGLNAAAHDARRHGLQAIPPDIAGPLLAEWKHAILCGLADNPRRPGREQTKTRNLLERLRDHQNRVLAFARDLTVPFTNNQAERDLRPAKTQLKISGCHRSTRGAEAWLRIRGYLSTARKNGHNAYTAIRDAITGTPWKPAVPTGT